ncbi:MAG: hypothetical protein BWY43_00828 [candidate division WS2 bacterium ADurb.Bin280]|uniref:Bacterial Ig-like domain-containing protein n=1 Tax=candidate division WS2 bacterium ADurb.Bin280 TaxID=1852829 RepID=A0A1V5SC37_9BACT|nr:MAG: hypothetical protein BWY43_00828 [candidate division WS2 bacterium ADurb.Bin280]
MTLGSGGFASGGGSGGGAIYFEIGGNSVINGDIDASANDAVAVGSARGSGGSGGSIFIKADSISGSGNILANGGAGIQYSGGGSGGRIALYGDVTSFPSNQISAVGGAHGGSGGQDGETGTIFIYNVATGDVTASNDVTFEATQGLSPDGSFRDDGVYYFNNFTVSDNATVTIASYYSDENDGRGVTLNIAGNLTVESGSTISADEQGFSGSVGAGKGLGSGNVSGSGASYGGLGGPSYNLIAPGSVYGSESASYPYMLGSGGGAGHSGVGGSGGGAITLRVMGDVVVDGEISADGGVGSGGFSSWRPGGGSGGSIFIVCSSISGTGTIVASGGDGLGDVNFGSGGGGGGRISIVYSTSQNMSTGNITAPGGAGGGGVAARNGSSGTVNITQRTLPAANFSLKNPNNNSTQYTNTLDVTIEPVEEDVSQYSESGSGSNLVPAFYDSSWKNIENGVLLSAGEGEKTVGAWLKDADQLISSQVGQATITLDLTDPIVDVDEIADQTEQASATISGNISDALSGLDRATISTTQAQSIMGLRDNKYSVFSEELTIDESGNFEINWDLNPGENEITITAYDQAGNETSQTLNIYSSQTSPTPTPLLAPSPTSTAQPQDQAESNPSASSTATTSQEASSDSRVASDGEDIGGIALLPSDSASEITSEKEMLTGSNESTLDSEKRTSTQEKSAEKNKYFFMIAILILIAIILIALGIKKRMSSSAR